MAPVTAMLLVLMGCTGCWIGGSKSKAKQVSVFDVKPGDCFDAPGQVKAELTKLNSVPCSTAHTQEAYARLPYRAKDGSTPSAYPGDALLKSFADGACAQEFTGYVGTDYLDSSLFFTYLLPSARGWEQQQDRNVVCFVTTTGKTLTSSVKGSKK
jgi:hypothetical protein